MTRPALYRVVQPRADGERRPVFRTADPLEAAAARDALAVHGARVEVEVVAADEIEQQCGPQG